ncbi:MAG: hypothetical protein AAF773_28005 [Cyanobacteria bacterium P01_D01_bin.115]
MALATGTADTKIPHDVAQQMQAAGHITGDWWVGIESAIAQLYPSV